VRRWLLILAVLTGSINNYLFYTSMGKKIERPGPVFPEKPIPPEEDPQPEPEKPKPEPPKPIEIEPEYINVPKVSNRVAGDNIYADIMNHARNPVFGYDEDTNAHETTHMINADIRNSNSNGRKVNGFYVQKSKGVIVAEPNMRKSKVVDFLPPSLRSYRYGTYITGQQAWDDTPLYIFDEWTAYVNGGMVSVELVQTGKHKGQWTDAVSGCLDFSIYSIATAMAVAKNDPEYWKTNTQFKNFLIWQLKRANDTYKVGSKMKEFTWDKQDKLLQSLRTAPEAAEMRKFIKENLNNIWLDSEDSIQSGYTDWHKGKTIKLNFIPPFEKEPTPERD
jgi:hypothetical protein